jgi:pyruvate ferredoxin oxidoreductase delta subunit
LSKPLEQTTWQELTIGCVMTEPGSAREYKTGDWRSQHPVWDRDRCLRCGVCWIFCPDSAIYETPEGYFDMNPDYCKGCGICGRECVTGCISYVPEGS